MLILYNSRKIKNLNIDFDEIGPWWGKNKEGGTEEIEIIANNKTTRQMILCEAKWTNKQVDVKDVKDLDRKSKLINATGTIHYLFVSKSGFSAECIDYMDGNGMAHLDLGEITELFDKAA
ncbi:DUF234 domain-containing protein [Candidatus Woesearchaeota archaeon]|nr:DUF234 domain-containing protein [Candidatus Woesearchaeota archaeon]